MSIFISKLPRTIAIKPQLVLPLFSLLYTHTGTFQRAVHVLVTKSKWQLASFVQVTS